MGYTNHIYRACIEKKSFKSHLKQISGICIICILSFTEGTVDPADIEDLFDQLEDYSDSGPDADTISIGSTPKPSLKPFFCSSRNLLHEARSVVAAAAVAKAQSELPIL